MMLIPDVTGIPLVGTSAQIENLELREVEMLLDIEDLS